MRTAKTKADGEDSDNGQQTAPVAKMAAVKGSEYGSDKDASKKQTHVQSRAGAHLDGGTMRWAYRVTAGVSQILAIK
ncbi:hypothetical protein NDU88_005135 [Pleurodeles waltl]|uniref:Uncharacterized protein n=1 Tax=Pleurodeles waltl TaxID=8319 RepID=A0AAV7SKV1_PLEWA|nr:hypothetical protein NDU88_005135 [Pleurodeles waltl]